VADNNNENIEKNIPEKGPLNFIVGSLTSFLLFIFFYFLSNKIVISPGPGNPNQSGNCLKIVKNLYKKIPILGVCLGHQALAQAFGGKVVVGKELMHGKTSKIFHNQKGLFKDIEVKLNFDEIKSVKLDISEGFNPRRRIALVLKGRKKPLPLSGAGELKPLLQVEEEGARLAKFLDVNLEGLK